MPTYLTPGIYVEEVAGGARPIQAVGTSTAGFVGVAPDADAHLNVPRAFSNWSQFVNDFVPEGSVSTPLSHAVYGFFENGGTRCYVVNVGAGQPVTGGGRTRSGIDVLELIDEVAIVAAPGFSDVASYEAILAHCERLGDRVAILDGPAAVESIQALTRVATAPAPPSAPPRSRGRGSDAASAEPAGTLLGEPVGEPVGEPSGTVGAGGSTPHAAAPPADAGAGVGFRPRDSDCGTFYFPQIQVRDPLSPGSLVNVAPSGHIAGIWARTDATRGVHKAPANEPIRGALNITQLLTDADQGELNPFGVNCIRFFSREGIRVWGARTLAAGSSEWRYLSVRRLFNMIKESIEESTRYIVFEPNDPTLWKNIRRDVGAFLTRVWRDGALMGRTPEEAFFVKCDDETNPPDVIDAGQVITLVGIAPVKPAEFVIFRISQSADGAHVDNVGGANA